MKNNRMIELLLISISYFFFIDYYYRKWKKGKERKNATINRFNFHNTKVEI